MNESRAATSLAAFAAVVLVGLVCGAPIAAQEKPDLSGRWVLSRGMSQLPREIGFGTTFASDLPSGSAAPASGGRGRNRSSGGGSGGGSPRRLQPESEDDAKRMQQLTAEARNPSAFLIIAETAETITFTDDRGRSRAVHPNGKEDVLRLDGVPLVTTARREVDRLVVTYQVEEGRSIRYTYSRRMNPSQLVVEVQFLEREGGDSARRIYTPASPADVLTAAPARPTSTPDPPPPGAGLPASAAASSPAKPLVGAPPPDSELKGLTRVGVVVEGLGAQAIACGLKQGVIDAALSKSVTDGGLKVIRNSDDDTYLYVNVITTTPSAGLCISRYDVILYTYAMTTLSFQTTPALVQVSLLHEGGLAGGSPAAHADSVLRGVTQYVDQFVARIRSASK
jgi:hypothetical protein